MGCRSADVERLSLLVRRLLDAEVLRSVEGEALVTVADAACRSQAEGDCLAARRHVEQVALFTEALVRTEAMACVDGQEVITAAHEILARK
jgi:hypothetical protein